MVNAPTFFVQAFEYLMGRFLNHMSNPFVQLCERSSWVRLTTLTEIVYLISITNKVKAYSIRLKYM